MGSYKSWAKCKPKEKVECRVKDLWDITTHLLYKVKSQISLENFRLMLVVHGQKKNQLSQRYSFQCCTLCCGKPTSTHSYNISKETYVTLKIEKKVTLRQCVLHGFCKYKVQHQRSGRTISEKLSTEVFSILLKKISWYSRLEFCHFYLG